MSIDQEEIDELEQDCVKKPPTSSDYYFFVHHLIATTVLISGIVVSLLPSTGNTSTHKYHIVLQFLLDLLPDRRWFIWGECLGLMAMMFSYSGLNLWREDVMSPALDDYKTIVDGAGNLEISLNDPLDEYLHKPTSGVVDLPIMTVCQVLYGERSTV